MEKKETGARVARERLVFREGRRQTRTAGLGYEQDDRRTQQEAKAS